MTEPDRYLLDTSVVIDLPDPTEIEPDAEYLISTITVAELNVGIHTADNPVQRSERLARLQWVSDAFDPLPFTVATARMYGQLVALLLAAGRNYRPRRMDLLIAAVAATYRLPLLTRNPADFADLHPLLVLIGLEPPPDPPE
ncbi:MAG: type II toxin-antitoxin system VapC family toxin [Pseudonocardiaceae bacterium]